MLLPNQFVEPEHNNRNLVNFLQISAAFSHCNYCFKDGWVLTFKNIIRLNLDHLMIGICSCVSVYAEFYWYIVFEDGQITEFFSRILFPLISQSFTILATKDMLEIILRCLQHLIYYITHGLGIVSFSRDYRGAKSWIFSLFFYNSESRNTSFKRGIKEFIIIFPLIDIY